MSLVIDISVNRQEHVSSVTAQRQDGPGVFDPTPDSVFIYRVERFERLPESGPMFLHTATTITHRYGDGATALAARALAAVYVEGEEWP